MIYKTNKIYLGEEMEENRGGAFYGAVTVSDRGQVVIPVQARRNLGIETGAKLLVIGGPGGVLILVKAEVLGQWMSRWTEKIRLLEQQALAADSVEGENEA
jgi:AbrB family looped-hinge helix DNA binding protein